MKIVRCLLGPLLAAAVSVASAAPALKLAPIAFTERTLANGLRVVAAENHASPTVSVQVWYHVGAKDDPPGRSGFAHLFEHMMFKSTRYLKNEQFDRLTEDVGGSNNAFTADDMTGYHEVVPSNHLERLLWAEAERMSNLSVDEGNFKSERAVVQEEYRQRVLAAPYGRFFNAIAPAAYLVHPYKRPGIGNIDELQAATLADVVAFHATHYRPDHATLVVAGDFDPAQLHGWVDKYFGPLARPAAPVPRVTAQEPVWPADRKVAVTGPQVPLPAVALVWQAPPVTSADAGALRVAAALLGSGVSARLNQALVYRRQLASQTGFEADLRAGPGLLTAYAIASDGKPITDVGKALMTEVMALAARPVSATELAKTKTLLLTQALVERQSPHGQASALAEAAVLHGRGGAANSLLEELQRVSAADVQRVMRRYVATAGKVTVTYTQAGKGEAPAPEGATK